MPLFVCHSNHLLDIIILSPSIQPVPPMSRQVDHYRLVQVLQSDCHLAGVQFVVLS